MKNSYYTYILTNKNMTVLYVGMTNNLEARLVEHYKNAQNNKKHFTSRYNCHYCVWFGSFQTPREAIEMEDRLKRLSRSAKKDLITKHNPEWKFLNQEILTKWPPDAWMLRWLTRDDS